MSEALNLPLYPSSTVDVVLQRATGYPDRHVALSFMIDHDAIASRDFETASTIYGRIHDFDISLRMFGSEMEPAVLGDAIELIVEGEDVKFIPAEDPVPDAWRRKAAGDTVAFFESMLLNQSADLGVSLALLDESLATQHPSELMYRSPALRKWRELSLGTGLGIYTLYGARDAKTLGDGIDPSIFTEPIFETQDGRLISAHEYIAEEKGQAEADEALQRHQDFITEEIDHVSRIIFSGSEDAVGVRVRADLARQMAAEALQDHDKSKPLVLASLGAGSAIPAIKTILDLQGKGFTVGTYHFVDNDPMALATAMSLVRSHGIDPSIIKLHTEYLGMSPRKREIASIEPGTVDLVDAWGLAEYFNDNSAPLLMLGAQNLLAEGGTFCYGNMLTQRLQNLYFNEVVQWEPKVQQRTLREGLRLLQDADFSETRISIPIKNGVYAGYAGRRNPHFDLDTAIVHFASRRKARKAAGSLSLAAGQ